MKKGDREQLVSARKALAESLDQVVAAVGDFLAPLRKLTGEQRDAVVMLGLLMQSINLAKRPPAMTSQQVLTQFKEEIDKVCPPLGEVVISKDPCFEASVAYVSALTKCEDEGKSEAECFDSWGPGAQSVMCAMQAIDDLKTEIGEILGRQSPPRPSPWPIEPRPY